MPTTTSANTAQAIIVMRSSLFFFLTGIICYSANRTAAAINSTPRLTPNIVGKDTPASGKVPPLPTVVGVGIAVTLPVGLTVGVPVSFCVGVTVPLTFVDGVGEFVTWVEPPTV